MLSADLLEFLFSAHGFGFRGLGLGSISRKKIPYRMHSLCRYFRTKVYTTWVHEPLGLLFAGSLDNLVFMD